MVKKASKKVEAPAVQKILLSVAVALVVMTAITALCAALVIGGTLPVASVNTATAVICAIGVFTGVRVALHGTKGKKLVYAGAVCAGCVLLSLLGNLMFVDTPPVGIGRITLAALIAGLGAWMLSGCKGKKSGAKCR